MVKVDFKNLDEGEQKELNEVVRLFDLPSNNLDIVCNLNGDLLININGKNYSPKSTDYTVLPIASHSAHMRTLKRALYDALVCATGQELPWGALTGIRPTKLAYELVKVGKANTLAEELTNLYRVESKRSALIKEIINAQKDYYFFDDNQFNFYVHIPFCTTKCKYCSFISEPIERCAALVQPYIETLKNEIKNSAECLKNSGKKVYSVYIGGGTPTALSAAQLYDILSVIPYNNMEYTLEAGRPDTIEEDKLSAAMSAGVNRICVNPQTLNDSTLKLIGRNHTAKDFINKYELVKKFGFKVNTDLIAGLEGENLDCFKNTIQRIAQLKPENITVHTLSLKNGSKYYNHAPTLNADTVLMMDYATDFLMSIGYKPYYIYRQKRMTANLENIGFSLPNNLSVNNITTMEETLSVMACGAGAISKFINNGVIKRFTNLRDVKLYCNDNHSQKIATFDKVFS